MAWCGKCRIEIGGAAHCPQCGRKSHTRPTPEELEEGMRIRKAILRWGRKAKKSLKESNSADIPYRSNIIPEEIAQSFAVLLGDAKSEQEITDSCHRIISQFKLGLFWVGDNEEPIDVSTMVSVNIDDLGKLDKDIVERLEQHSPLLAGLINAEVMPSSEEE